MPPDMGTSDCSMEYHSGHRTISSPGFHHHFKRKCLSFSLCQWLSLSLSFSLSLSLFVCVCVCLCVCVCVCVYVNERDRDRERQRETETERQRECHLDQGSRLATSNCPLFLRLAICVPNLWYTKWYYQKFENSLRHSSLLHFVLSLFKILSPVPYYWWILRKHTGD